MPTIGIGLVQFAVSLQVHTEVGVPLGGVEVAFFVGV